MTPLDKEIMRLQNLDVWIQSFLRAMTGAGREFEALIGVMGDQEREIERLKARVKELEG